MTLPMPLNDLLDGGKEEFRQPGPGWLRTGLCLLALAIVFDLIALGLAISAVSSLWWPMISTLLTTIVLTVIIHRLRAGEYDRGVAAFMVALIATVGAFMVLFLQLGVSDMNGTPFKGARTDVAAPATSSRSASVNDEDTASADVSVTPTRTVDATGTAEASASSTPAATTAPSAPITIPVTATAPLPPAEDQPTASEATAPAFVPPQEQEPATQAPAPAPQPRPQPQPDNQVTPATTKPISTPVPGSAKQVDDPSLQPGGSGTDNGPFSEAPSAPGE